MNSPTPPILVVDDDPQTLEVLRDTLELEHYQFLTCAEPSAALAELKQREVCLILADQRMPGMTGLELLAQARQLRPEATRILMTGVLSLDTVIEAINTGELFRFIVKPWLREEFLATIKNGLQRYELVCHNARLQAATQAMNEQLVELNRSLQEQVKLIARQNQQLGEMNEALEANFLRSLELCVHTMATFEPSLGNQARRLARLCVSIAKVVSLSAHDARLLQSAAHLHDIGLIGLPRQLIRRWHQNPTQLNAEESALIQRHPILGQELAAFGSGLDQVGEIIRAHHERFDGLGYPDQLRGEAIPWLSRLLAVAVAYAASPVDPAFVLDEIKLASGAAFDPEAVRVLLRALPLAELPRREKEVALAELRPGMVLARGIYTSSGLLLMPEGQPLNSIYIEKILNHNRTTALTQSLVVYC